MLTRNIGHAVIRLLVNENKRVINILAKFEITVTKSSECQL